MTGLFGDKARGSKTPDGRAQRWQGTAEHEAIGRDGGKGQWRHAVGRAAAGRGVVGRGGIGCRWWSIVDHFEHIAAVRSLMKRSDEAVQMRYKMHSIAPLKLRSNGRGASRAIKSEPL